jgi:hypothetical protein
MSLGNSILNPIFFKKIGGSYPNDYNRLHKDRKHGTFNVIPYQQKFNCGDVVTVQFSSELVTVPTLTSYFGVTEIETIGGAAGTNSPRVGSVGTLYFFNFEITFDSKYYDKEISFVCIQETDTLYSEPIFVYDMTKDLAQGVIKRIEYTNLSEVESDLNGFLIDWEDLTSTGGLLFYYVEGQDLEPADKEEQEVLEGSMSSNIISGSFTPGKIFKTCAIPVYMYARLSASMLVDYLTVNDIEYLKNGVVKKGKFGTSTSFQCEVSLQEKQVFFFDVDTNEIVAMREILNHHFYNVVTDFDEATPEGYGLHRIIVKRSATSSTNAATFIAGTTIGGTDYVDAIMGTIEDGERHTFEQHDIPGHVYFGVSGIGIKLDINIQYLIEE